MGGSSGECIYQSVEERKIVLEHVVKAAEGKLTIIAHVACNNTKDSKVLAAHAKVLVWMRLQQFLRFIFIYQNMRLQNIGMIFHQQHQIQIL